MTKAKEMTREQIIQELLQNDCATCDDEWEYTADLLRNGFLGYDNMSTMELAEEYEAQLGERVVPVIETIIREEDIGLMYRV